MSHQKACSHGDDQFEPVGELGDDLGDKGGDSVSIVWFVKLCLIQPVNQDDAIFLWNLPL